jgi:hypothetical protein
MGEIVTDGVGHWRTYGPRGQVKGGNGELKRLSARLIGRRI